jgi:hypothetical protein
VVGVVALEKALVGGAGSGHHVLALEVGKALMPLSLAVSNCPLT